MDTENQHEYYEIEKREQGRMENLLPRRPILILRCVFSHKAFDHLSANRFFKFKYKTRVSYNARKSDKIL